MGCPPGLIVLRYTRGGNDNIITSRALLFRRGEGKGSRCQSGRGRGYQHSLTLTLGLRGAIMEKSMTLYVQK